MDSTDEELMEIGEEFLSKLPEDYFYNESPVEYVTDLENQIYDLKHFTGIEGFGALQDVLSERKRQDGKWGGPSHDDNHTTAEFVQWIEDYAGWARMMDSMQSFDKARRRLVQVAALAVAAVESIDRKRGR